MSMSINSEMRPKDMERLLGLSPTGDKFLKKLEGQSLSPRSFYRLLKTARTIADLENDSAVSEDHLAEAFSYRLRETA
jgi:magnesium chelatase family protein